MEVAMINLNGFTENDLIRYKHSSYQIVFRNDNFEILDTEFYDMTCAFEFSEWADALAYLIEDVKVI